MADNTPWSQPFNFKQSDGGWIAASTAEESGGASLPYYCHYTFNTGWVADCNLDIAGNMYQRVVSIIRILPASAVLTSVTFEYDATIGSNPFSAVYITDANGAILTTDSTFFAQNGSNQVQTIFINSHSLAAGIRISLAGDQSGAVNCGSALMTLKAITLSGIGLNPFLKHKGPKDCPFCDAAIGADVGGG